MTAKEILTSHSLKRTSCREEILEVLLHSTQALSEDEIRIHLLGDYDRSTFYRSFKTLEEKNILHKIVIGKNAVKYELATALTKKNKHAHFYCKECDTVKCLEDVPENVMNFYDQKADAEVEIVVKGICEKCKL